MFEERGTLLTFPPDSSYRQLSPSNTLDNSHLLLQNSSYLPYSLHLSHRHPLSGTPWKSCIRGAGPSLWIGEHPCLSFGEGGNSFWLAGFMWNIHTHTHTQTQIEGKERKKVEKKVGGKEAEPHVSTEPHTHILTHWLLDPQLTHFQYQFTLYFSFYPLKHNSRS